MVQEFDDDGSGLIEFEEFLVLMAKKVGSCALFLFVLILCLCSLFLALMPKKVRSCVLSFFDSSSKTKLPLYVCKIKAKVKNTDSKC